jgi:squalene-associated FAD-dependent desaturase
MNVAVLGAGWAGLAAAVELARAGIAVTVFEAARSVGGRARRVDANGLALDNGAHILVGAYRESLRLMRLVRGDASGLQAQPLDLHIPGRFRLRALALPAPLHLAWGLLRAQGLGWSERLAAARFMQRMRATGFRLASDTTVEALLAQHGQGRNARRYLWDALCVAALNTAASEASAQVFLNVLRDSLAGPREDSQLLLPAEDLGALFPEPAARYVEARGGHVRRGNAVQQVQAAEGAFEVATPAASERFEQVICALPPQRVPAVLSRIPGLDGVFEQLAAFRYEPIVTVYLQYRAGVRLPQAMLGLADSIGQWVFDRGRLSGQDGLLAVVISARGAHAGLDHPVLAARVHEELRAVFPGTIPGPPGWTKVIAEHRATFACTPGLQRPTQRTPVAGLFLAGDYTASPYPGTLESAVRSGIACAQLALSGTQSPRAACVTP